MRQIARVNRNDRSARWIVAVYHEVVAALHAINDEPGSL
jgi:hypothetical protein